MKLSKRNILWGLILIVTIPAKSQFKNYNTENEIWYRGTVYDNNGNITEGLINYNFVVDNIRLKVGNEIKTLIPKNVSRFTLEDSSSVQYDFYSIPFDFEKRGRDVPTFFLKLYRNENYILLSKHFIDFKHNHIPVPYVTASLKVISEKVSQVIFIADGEKDITPCLEKKKINSLTLEGIELGYYGTDGESLKHGSSKRYNQGQLDSSVRNQSVKKYKLTYGKVFQEYFQGKYKRFEQFVNQNNIDIQTIGGLIEALEFDSAK